MNELFEDQGIAILGPFPPRPGGVSVQCAMLADQLTAAGAIVTRINTDIPMLRKRGRWVKLFLPLIQVVHLIQVLVTTRHTWDILHVHAASWWGFMPAVVALIALRWHKRLILSYHGGEAAKFLSRWAWLAAPVLRRYDNLLVLTQTQAQFFWRYRLNAEIVPNIVQVDDFHFRQRGPVKPRILWLRQLEARYRPNDALDVYSLVRAKYPETSLMMAGGGPLFGEMAQRLKQQQLRQVKLVGQLSQTEISKAYDAADIFLNTSEVDNLPLTLIEASASGLAVVSTNAGAIPDLIISGVNGLLAPVADIKGLADGILRLLTDPDLASTLSRAAHENASSYTWQQIAPRLLASYGLAPFKSPSQVSIDNELR